MLYEGEPQMKVSRMLGTTAAAAIMVLAPQAAFASDYNGGGVGPNEGQQGGGNGGGGVGPNEGSLGRGAPGAGVGVVGAGAGAGSGAGVGSVATGALPSTGSTPLDTAIGGAGLALVLGGGALIVASRRREAEAQPA